MIKFPEEKIIQTLSGKLSWSHFIELLRIDDKLKLEFLYSSGCKRKMECTNTKRSN